MAYFDDRGRAESFGQVALDYDRFRPRYPRELIAAMLDRSSGAGAVGGDPPRRKALRVLDVGSGTGILASQLETTDAEVLAVEPDDQMAGVAAAKGLSVEISTFEQWQAAGRIFDLVTFGQSFHWVDPALALPRTREILAPGGRLALAWNDIHALGDVGERLTAIADGFHPEGKDARLGPGAHLSAVDHPGRDERSAVGDPDDSDSTGRVEHPALAELHTHGFSATVRHFDEARHFSADAWLSMIFTHSAQLTMPKPSREAMRSELAAAIPESGVETRNLALLILSEPLHTSDEPPRIPRRD